MWRPHVKTMSADHGQKHEPRDATPEHNVRD